jgi:hypothetical protein
VRWASQYAEAQKVHEQVRIALDDAFRTGLVEMLMKGCRQNGGASAPDFHP